MKTKCDICGHDCNYEEDGISKTSIGVHYTVKEGTVDYDRIMYEFGRSEFCLCHVCWLKSMGFKDNLLHPSRRVV